MTTIQEAFSFYIHSVSQSRSENTARTYQNAISVFKDVLIKKKIDPQTKLIAELPEDAISWLAASLKSYSPSTERLYLTAVRGFYEFNSAENLSSPNLSRIRLLIKQRSRKPGQRLPQFPRNQIEKVIESAINIASMPDGDETENLRYLRDRAFILTLADTGLRVHEACNLIRGDIDWNEGRALVIGKGNRQAVVRFSVRSLNALKSYLSSRARMDGGSGKPLTSLPLFARHDKGAGKKIKKITTTTGRNIISERVKEVLGDLEDFRITPHSFRHYFVTTILQGSGNLKLAQELARHKSISVTQMYTHLSNDELDKGYSDIFDR
jgi:integrase/recombinase XerC